MTYLYLSTGDLNSASFLPQFFLSPEKVRRFRLEQYRRKGANSLCLKIGTSTIHSTAVPSAGSGGAAVLTEVLIPALDHHLEGSQLRSIKKEL